jgi:hypothetical protein
MTQTPAPTSDVTPTPTVTEVTPTPTTTATGTPGVSPTQTPAVTVSNTPLPTPTPTASVTPTVTPSVTPSSSPIVGTVNITNRTISDVPLIAVAMAGVLYESDGQFSETRALANNPIAGEWATPVNPAVGPQFDIMVTLNSGTAPTGPALGVWHSLSSNRSWSITDFAADGVPVTSQITVQIRNASTLVVQDTAVIDLFADTATIR